MMTTVLLVLAFSPIDDIKPSDLGFLDSLPKAAADVLKNPGHVEVYSLDPNHRRVMKGDETFHGHKVLGRIPVQGEDARHDVAAAVLEGVLGGTGPATCFEPRHGFRVTHDGKTVDLLICFHCRATYVYLDGDFLGLVGTEGSAEAALDKLLKDADVPLAPKADN